MDKRFYDFLDVTYASLENMGYKDPEITFFKYDIRDSYKCKVKAYYRGVPFMCQFAMPFELMEGSSWTDLSMYFADQFREGLKKKENR